MKPEILCFLIFKFLACLFWGKIPKTDSWIQKVSTAEEDTSDQISIRYFQIYNLRSQVRFWILQKKKKEAPIVSLSVQGTSRYTKQNDCLPICLYPKACTAAWHWIRSNELVFQVYSGVRSSVINSFFCYCSLFLLVRFLRVVVVLFKMLPLIFA